MTPVTLLLIYSMHERYARFVKNLCTMLRVDIRHVEMYTKIDTIHRLYHTMPLELTLKCTRKAKVDLVMSIFM